MRQEENALLRCASDYAVSNFFLDYVETLRARLFLINYLINPN